MSRLWSSKWLRFLLLGNLALQLGCGAEAREGGPTGGDEDAARTDLGGTGPADSGPRPVDLGAPGEEDAAMRPDGSTRLDTGLPAEDVGRLPDDAGGLPDQGSPDDTGFLADLDPGADAGWPGDAGGAADLTLTEDGGGDPGCDPADPGEPDRERIVLVGHPFGGGGGHGTEVSSYRLTAGGELKNEGTRLDVGVRPARLGILPRGDLALVLAEDGELVSVALAGPRQLEVVDQLALPGGGYSDLVLHPDGRTVFAINEDVGADSGITVVTVACDGVLTHRPDAFLNIRLANSLTLLPDDRAVLLGGQAVFDPVDPDDLRLLTRDGLGWRQLGAFDIYGDFIDAGRIASSPDGRTVIVPNASPFSAEGNQIAVLAVDGNTLVETGRLENVENATEALFAFDGATALVSQPEANRIAVLADQGEGLVVVDELTGLGLADQLAQVTRGNLAGLVIVPDFFQGEPDLAVLRIRGPGQVEIVSRLPLGEGLEQIPDAIAVTP